MIIQLIRLQERKPMSGIFIIILPPMQKQTHLYIWPKPTLHSIQLINHFQIQQNLTIHNFQRKYIQYLIFIIQNKNISIAVFQLALSLASQFIKKNSTYSEPIQLTLLVCLLIASKTLQTQCISVLTLHSVSNHCYTNKDIYRMENRILEDIDYDIHSQMIIDHKVKTLLKILQSILPENSLSMFISLAQDIQLLLVYFLYTNKNGINKKVIEILPYAIVQIALIFTTQCSGRFPVTAWMSNLGSFREDKLLGVVDEFIKILIGQQKYKELNI